MANKIKGRVHTVFPTEVNEYNGKKYSRQRIVLNCTTYDQYTGEPRPNYPQIEFFGKIPENISGLSSGDLVEVTFFLNGVQYSDRATGEEKYFTSVRGYMIESVEPQNILQKTSPAPSSNINDMDDLPF